MTDVLAGIEPKALWGHFDDIRKIPRASRKEEAVRAHIRRWAADRGFESVVDAAGNLIVYVPATQGYEGGETVILQGHLDMVCEKNEDTVFDFDKDPILLARDGDWISAQGTTLGADNGIGVAAAMGLADDPSVKHGPLELLFTIDEETGLNGAFNLDGSLFKGKNLVNMDSEEWGYIFVGCAGGGDMHLDLPLTRKPIPAGYATYSLKVRGLLGGHSGLNIVDNRANAVRLLATTLQAFRAADKPFSLVDFNGGDKHNAIPRESNAVFAGPADALADFKALAAEAHAGFMLEYGKREPEITVTVDPCECAGDAIDGTTWLDFIQAIPHGVETMSLDIAGLVDTSTNLARAKVEGEHLKVLTSTRSSVAPPLETLRDKIRAVAVLAGASYEMGKPYPGWQPDMDSPLLATCLRVYEKLYGKAPEVTAIHAGLECGIVGEKIPGLKMISYGPDLRDVHSPREKVSISTTALFWDYTKAVLEDLAS